MEEIENKIDIVIKMLQSEVAWEYQRLKSHTEEKSIDAFVSRSAAKDKAKELILDKIKSL